MKAILLVTGLIIICSSCTTSVPPSNEAVAKVEAVTPDYEILSIKERTRSGERPLMWRCFPIKDVKVNYRIWKDNDPMGPSNVIAWMVKR